ncbi:hypothetical protein BDV12DRAFT_161754 [Aspergillus spectabilis]
MRTEALEGSSLRKEIIGTRKVESRLPQEATPLPGELSPLGKAASTQGRAASALREKGRLLGRELNALTTSSPYHSYQTRSSSPLLGRTRSSDPRKPAAPAAPPPKQTLGKRKRGLNDDRGKGKAKERSADRERATSEHLDPNAEAAANDSDLPAGKRKRYSCDPTDTPEGSNKRTKKKDQEFFG